MQAALVPGAQGTDAMKALKLKGKVQVAPQFGRKAKGGRTRPAMD
jgi:hypothetical protein